jgi:hypothetical protein
MKLINVMNRGSSKCGWLLRSSATLLALAALAAIPSRAHAGVFISVGFAPPPLPIYVQPIMPAPGYLWTPGYWSYAPDGGYFWVPGTWVLAPFAGALWTPGYWGWSGGVYVFHGGYWGRHVGFYGGINYGYGYTGVGYAGGYWRGGGFYYNRSVNHLGGNVPHIYNQTVINNVTINHTSFNGGHGGVMARETPQEMSFAREQHIAPVASQQQQMSIASHNQALRASFNHGNPPIAATARAGTFSGPGVVGSRGAVGGFSSEAAHTQRISGVNTRPLGNNTVVRSATFAPHANAASHQVARSHATYSPQAHTYRPQSTTAYHQAAYHPQTRQVTNRPMASHAAAPHAQVAHQRSGAPHGDPHH